jgi:hypothetical protein
MAVDLTKERDSLTREREVNGKPAPLEFVVQQYHLHVGWFSELAVLVIADFIVRTILEH